MGDQPFVCSSAVVGTGAIFQFVSPLSQNELYGKRLTKAAFLKYTNTSNNATQLKVFSLPTPGGPQTLWSSAAGPPQYGSAYPDILHPLVFTMEVQSPVEL